MRKFSTEVAFTPSTPLPLRPVLSGIPLRSPIRPKRFRTSSPNMLIERLRELSDAVFKQFSNAMPSTPAAATAPAPKGTPLSGDRSVVLVTGATGKTGQPIVRELLSSGAATKVIAHVSPRAEEVPNWNEEKVTMIRADLATTDGISKLVSFAKEAGVGSVVFAATGGPNGCREVDNLGVERLASAFAPLYTRDMPELFKFPEAAESFSPLDDVIMGGRSDSTMTVSDEGYVTFTGNVTTLGGGGFAQTRTQMSGSTLSNNNATVDLSGYDGVQLRIRGDGQSRMYKLNLKDDDVPDFAFQSVFTVSTDTWQTIRLPFTSFIPMKRGKPQYADEPGSGDTYSRSLDLTRVSAFGIVLSLVANDVKIANVREREGPFALDVSKVEVYEENPPRFVLVSSAAVTRLFWSEEEKRAKGEAVTQIPIVQLNPGQLLAHKLAGENGLRGSGINYCVVRPIGLNDTVEDGRKLILGQGDTLSGRLNRADVARCVVSSLRSKDTAYKTFEVGVNPDQVGTEIESEEFASLKTDETEQFYAAAVREMLANPPAPAVVG